MSKIKDMQRRFKENRYTGFGSLATSQADRLLNKDGSYNVLRTGLSSWEGISPFHTLISMRWLPFMSIVIGFYLITNLAFTCLYFLVGFDGLMGLTHISKIHQFLEVFFFSAQTLTTVGYGRINPVDFDVSIISSIEALTGLMSFALVTGLLYGRFSRPQAKLIYSQNALIAPFGEETAFMFRIANARKNQLVECEATLLMSYIEVETNIRRFIPLELEYSKINALALSWTLVHPINDKSLLHEFTEEDLIAADAEFILLFKAFDDTYSQNVHTRHSYVAAEVLWGAKFTPMYGRSTNGKTTILRMDEIGAYERADLPIKQKRKPEEASLDEVGQTNGIS